MIEATLALETAIRERLILNSAVSALVPADRIRSGTTRPDSEREPCVLMSNGMTTLHGYDYTAQRTAWAYLDLHVWTFEAEQDAVKEVAGAVLGALDKRKLQIEGGYCDHFRATACRFVTDPDPDHGHAVISVEALIRWFV
ncbi:DUF3168 domain-containing protein [Martelella mediterranea]|uniref:DUF3168 domain-containing protein n=1 Tax=Martelella mediterranea TaxID=293089 RepID=UPI001E563733|nr:DUF3168 domain-containing protein [Martelella mediterranea]MCD1634545.1 DUF3168 domain-containing protein [Martelella mediterranea]